MRKVTLIALAATLLWPCSLEAEEVLSGESERDYALDNRYSIGLNDIPWNATRVSFRLWRKERKGLELSIGKIDFGSESQSEFAIYRFIKVEQIRFDLLSRSQPMSIEGLFLVRGYGLGFSGDAWEQEDDRRTVYDDAYRLRQRARIYLYLYMPLGIEYFFWERYPNISFSVHADFYFRFGYGYNYEYEIYYDRSEYENHSVYFTLGLDPSFYIRFYFK